MKNGPRLAKLALALAGLAASLFASLSAEAAFAPFVVRNFREIGRAHV